MSNESISNQLGAPGAPSLFDNKAGAYGILPGRAAFCTGTLAVLSNASSSCLPCGGPGQRCCTGQDLSGNTGYCAPPYGCDNGFCAACGGSAQVCCPGGLCQSGVCSASGGC